MSDDMAKRTVNRRGVLKKMGAGGAVFAGGIAASSSTAAAEDANGTPYCYEDDAACDPKYPPGTKIAVSGPDPESMAGTFENCCIADTCPWYKMIVGACGEDKCPGEGYREDGETGTVLGTCSYGPLGSPNVLVEWDSDNNQSHIGEDFIAEA